MKSIIDNTKPVHYIVDLHNALCGSGWLQGSGNEHDVTCVECRRILKSRRMEAENGCESCSLGLCPDGKGGFIPCTICGNTGNPNSK